jgi:hypothetical protein
MSKFNTLLNPKVERSLKLIVQLTGSYWPLQYRERQLTSTWQSGQRRQPNKTGEDLLVTSEPRVCTTLQDMFRNMLGLLPSWRLWTMVNPSGKQGMPIFRLVHLNVDVPNQLSLPIIDNFAIFGLSNYLIDKSQLTIIFQYLNKIQKFQPKI